MIRFLFFAAASCLLGTGVHPNAGPARPAARATLAAPVPLDTLVDVGGHRLHFQVWKGSSSVILFEAGGGDDLGVWSKLLAPIYQATGATLVAYERAGFGKSELDGTRMSLTQQVTDLKTGLRKLALPTSYLLVGHSFGGFFSTAFAARYPAQVKGAVLLDASHVSYYTDARIGDFEKEYGPMKAQFKLDSPGKYWMLENARRDRDEMRQLPFPKRIPVVDLLAERPAVRSAEDLANWRTAHKQFVKASPKRRLVEAIGAGHYIMNDKPALVVDAITQLYQATQGRTAPAN